MYGVDGKGKPGLDIMWLQVVYITKEYEYKLSNIGLI